MRIRFTSAFQACLVLAVAILAFGDAAGATEAHYQCSGGGKLSAEFSPPSAAKGEVALTFDTGRELTLPQVMAADTPTPASSSGSRGAAPP